MQHQWSSAGEQFLICEFELDGAQYSGSLHQFGTSDLIVDTDVALRIGSEIEVRLTRSPAFPEIWLDVSVAAELGLPEASQMQHRFRLRILNLPPEYLIAVGAHSQDRTRDTGNNEDGQSQLASRAHMKSSEAEWIRTLEPGDAKSRRKRRRERISSAASVVHTWAGEPPAVVVIDGGELDDVAALLEEHGVEFSRTTVNDASELGGWALPSRLLVTTPRLALALRIPQHGASEHLVSIAIGEADSSTLQSMIQRVGFQYLVRRPVHTEALRLLLLQAVYRGRNRRESRRLAVGCEVTWSLRWRRYRDPMLEISMNGCRLLTDSKVPIGSRIKIRVPNAEADGGQIALRGHVARCASVHTRGERKRFTVSMTFEPLSGKSACQLEQLLRLRATGPATLDRCRWTPPVASASNPTQIEASDGAPAEPSETDSTNGESENVINAEPGGTDSPSDKSENVTNAESRGTESTSGESENVINAEPPAPEAPGSPSCETAGHRRAPRRVFRGEIVALAPDVDRVVRTLVGRDLSRDGLRVEAHPLIAMGDRIRVGLYDAYDAATGEPLIVNAVVARDDGLLGLWLRFEDTDAATLEQIELHMKTLTPIESLNTNDGEVDTESVVFADLFEADTPDAADPANSPHR
jgi:hypothetical protein